MEQSENALKKIFPREAIKRGRCRIKYFLKLGRLAAKFHPLCCCPPQPLRMFDCHKTINTVAKGLLAYSLLQPSPSGAPKKQPAAETTNFHYRSATSKKSPCRRPNGPISGSDCNGYNSNRSPHRLRFLNVSCCTGVDARRRLVAFTGENYTFQYQ